MLDDLGTFVDVGNLDFYGIESRLNKLCHDSFGLIMTVFPKWEFRASVDIHFALA